MNIYNKTKQQILRERNCNLKTPFQTNNNFNFGNKGQLVLPNGPRVQLGTACSAKRNYSYKQLANTDFCLEKATKRSRILPQQREKVQRFSVRSHSACALICTKERGVTLRSLPWSTARKCDLTMNLI